MSLLATSFALGAADHSWRDQALCRDTDPELFFPIGTTGFALLQLEKARQVCGECQVRAECLEFDDATERRTLEDPAIELQAADELRHAHGFHFQRTGRYGELPHDPFESLPVASNLLCERVARAKGPLRQCDAASRRSVVVLQIDAEQSGVPAWMSLFDRESKRMHLARPYVGVGGAAHRCRPP